MEDSEGKTQEEEQDLPYTVTYKSPGVPLFEIPRRRHQPRLFLCYYTINKLLNGTRYLRPGVEPVRKPGLTAWLGVSRKAPIGSLQPPTVKVFQSQQWKSLALWMWLLKCLPVVRPGCFLNTLRTGRNIRAECQLIFKKGEVLLISHGDFFLSLGSKCCKKTPHRFLKMAEDCYGLSTRKG